MKIKKIKWTSTIAILTVMGLSSTASMAQVGGGNGGDPNELASFTGKNGENLPSWYVIKSDLIDGLNLNKHLQIDLKGINPAYFKAKALTTLLTTRVEFKNEWIRINEVDRPCKNFIDAALTPHIQCNPTQYVAAMALLTSEEQYKLVAHEYLSAAGLEPNQYGISDYPFSSQISASLHHVVLNLWASGLVSTVKVSEEALYLAQRIYELEGEFHPPLQTSDSEIDCIALGTDSFPVGGNEVTIYESDIDNLLKKSCNTKYFKRLKSFIFSSIRINAVEASGRPIIAERCHTLSELDQFLKSIPNNCQN